MIALALLFAASTTDLHLSCDGVASKTVGHTTTAAVYGDNGHFSTGHATNYAREETPDHLAVEVTDTSGRIQVPRSMLPPMNSGGVDGWWSLSDVTVTDTAISAQFRLNPFNHPNVRIDRTTGSVSIDGFGGGFHGSCQIADPAAKRF